MSSKKAEKLAKKKENRNEKIGRFIAVMMVFVIVLSVASIPAYANDPLYTKGTYGSVAVDSAGLYYYNASGQRILVNVPRGSRVRLVKDYYAGELYAYVFVASGSRAGYESEMARNSILFDTPEMRIAG